MHQTRAINPSEDIPRLHCDRCRAGLVDAHSTNPVRHLLAFRLQLHGPEADRTNHRQLLRLFHLTPAVCRWSTCTCIQLGRNYAHICHSDWHWPQYYWAHGDVRFWQWTIPLYLHRKVRSFIFLFGNLPLLVWSFITRYSRFMALILGRVYKFIQLCCARSNTAKKSLK